MTKFSLHGMREIKRNELPEVRAVIESGRKRNRERYSISDFLNNKVNIIAEIKKSSPSQGEINKDSDITEQMDVYVGGGASAVSVLTEKNYFGGEMKNLEIISSKCSLPVLCKDFIYFEEQIDAANILGADLVLLIVKSLGDEELEHLYRKTVELGLTPLLEIHEFSEFERIKKLNPEVVLVNMRNLDTLEIKFDVGMDSLNKLPESIIKISASGINNPDDIRKIKDKTGVNNFLIGTSLMKNGNPGEMIRSFKDVS